MEDANSELIEEAIAAYVSIYRILQRGTAPVWCELELTTAQLKVLFILAQEAEMSIGRLAELLDIGPPTATHLINRLVQSGLASRVEDVSDRRRMLACLTPQGHDLVSRLRQGGRELLADWLRQLDEDDLQALARGLSTLAAVALASVEQAQAVHA